MSNHERKGPQPATGDAGLERAWQQASDESPPSSLDAAIIAAAHKAVEAPVDTSNVVRGRFGSRAWLARWQPFAAAAAVAGIAFTLVQSLPREHEVTSTPARTEIIGGSSAAMEAEVDSADTRQVTESPALKQRGAVDAAPPTTGFARDDSASVAAPPPAADSGVASDMSSAAAARPTESTSTAFPASEPSPPVAQSSERLPAAFPATASSPRAAPAMPPTSDSSAPAASRSSASKAIDASADTAAAAPAAEQRRSDDSTMLSTEARVARIVALHTSGELARAAEELRTFRADVEDADSYLPETLHAWARSVR